MHFNIINGAVVSDDLNISTWQRKYLKISEGKKREKENGNGCTEIQGMLYYIKSFQLVTNATYSTYTAHSFLTRTLPKSSYYSQPIKPSLK